MCMYPKVSAVAARGPNLLVAAGAEVYVHDIATGAVVRKFQGLHEGQVTCVEGSMNGRMLFTGARMPALLPRNRLLLMQHAHASCLHSP